MDRRANQCGFISTVFSNILFSTFLSWQIFDLQNQLWDVFGNYSEQGALSSVLSSLALNSNGFSPVDCCISLPVKGSWVMPVQIPRTDTCWYKPVLSGDVYKKTRSSRLVGSGGGCRVHLQNLHRTCPVGWLVSLTQQDLTAKQCSAIGMYQYWLNLCDFSIKILKAG